MGIEEMPLRERRVFDTPAGRLVISRTVDDEFQRQLSFANGLPTARKARPDTHEGNSAPPEWIEAALALRPRSPIAMRPAGAATSASQSWLVRQLQARTL